jgi:aspartate aminotransferase-like enzyme
MSQLRIPGPTPCPPEVLAIMSKQMINHRGSEFHGMLTAVTNNLKAIYQTRSDMLVLTGSGTGGLEAGVVNFMSPGDKVLSVSIGVFGDRWANIAKAFGANVIKLNFEMGKAADAEAIRKSLIENPDIKIVMVTQNETSTGVTNDIQTISKVVHEYDKLLLMDGISGLSSIDCPVDAWNIDVAIGGSQKGWMVPPGLAFVSVNQKGWEYFAKARMPRFYWDLGKAKEYLAKEENPWTPAVNIIYGLTVSLDMIMKEGLQNVFARHARIARICRDEAKALGLKLVAENEKFASNTVSSVYLPPGIDYKTLSKNMREDYKITITGGQGALDGKIFRIGHLGWVSEADIKECMTALKGTLSKMGYKK